MDIVEQFNEYRQRMNQRISESDNLILKRLFNLDTNAYAVGILDVKTKELIGFIYLFGGKANFFTLSKVILDAIVATEHQRTSQANQFFCFYI